LTVNGGLAQRRTLEIEVAGPEGVSLDDVLGPAPYEPDEEAAPARLAAALPGAVIGTVSGLDESGRPLVVFPAGVAQPATAARRTVALGESDVGREVVLVFEGGDAARPIVVGVLQPAPSAQPATAPGTPSKASAVEARLDGEQIVLSAEREIVLRCGEASITLTRAGKVLIRGAYLLSRSSGVNRIKGGSVQIN
jgi:hypothetical protein